MRNVSYQILPIIVVNEGASFGPRVATTVFRNDLWHQRPFRQVDLVIDLDGRQYQDESGIRRRAGRAAVTFGRNAAKRIGGGSVVPVLKKTTSDPPWATASWEYEEVFEGFRRLVRARADFPFNSDDAELVIPPSLAEIVASQLRRMCDDLHVTIDDPAFSAVFGGS